MSGEGSASVLLAALIPGVVLLIFRASVDEKIARGLQDGLNDGPDDFHKDGHVTRV